MSQEVERRDAITGHVEPAFPTEWKIEICARCGLTTEYDRDYGGPFPTTTCGRADCPTERGGMYATCPAVETITVVRKPQ
jgi:hypothetical protein